MSQLHADVSPQWYGRRAHAPPCTSLVPRPRPPGAFARSNGGIWERDYYLVTGVRDAVGDPEMQPAGDAARLVSFPRNSINGEGSGNARLGKIRIRLDSHACLYFRCCYCLGYMMSYYFRQASSAL